MKQILSTWAMGLAIVILGLGIGIDRAMAQNNSDVTGVDVGNVLTPPAGDSGSIDAGSGSGELSPDTQVDATTVEQANGLAQALEDAYAACLASRNAMPRRFARGSTPAEENCTTAECDRLNQMVQEARALLSRLNSTQREQLRNNPAFRLW